jgi:hypothetical protein
MSANPDVFEIESRLAEARLSEERAVARVKELTEALEIAKFAGSVVRETDEATKLEVGLEGLPWKEATSKKCDYVRDAPPDLVEAVRKSKGGVKGASHHFTASSTEPTLFRFMRGPKQ